jgi:hypothetical protein
LSPPFVWKHSWLRVTQRGSKMVTVKSFTRSFLRAFAGGRSGREPPTGASRRGSGTDRDGYQRHPDVFSRSGHRRGAAHLHGHGVERFRYPARRPQRFPITGGDDRLGYAQPRFLPCQRLERCLVPVGRGPKWRLGHGHGCRDSNGSGDHDEPRACRRRAGEY